MAVMKIRLGGRWVSLSGGSGGISDGTIKEIIDTANKYTDEMSRQLNNAIGDLTADVTNIDEYIQGAFRDGIISEIEVAKIESYLKAIETSKVTVDNEYNEIYNNEDVPASRKNSLSLAKQDFDTKHSNLIRAITDAIADRKATENETNLIDSAFTAYNNAIAFFNSILLLAIQDITDTKLSPIIERITLAESEITRNSEEIKLRVSESELTEAMTETLRIAEEYTDGIMVGVNTDIGKLESDIQETSRYIDGAFKDGIIYDSERKKIEAYLKTLETSKVAVDNRYNEIFSNTDLLDPHKSNLQISKEEFDTVSTDLITLINDVIEDGLADLTEVTEVENKFNEYFDKLALLEANLEVAVNSIGNVKEQRALEQANEYAEGLQAVVNEDIQALQTALESVEDFVDGSFRDFVISESESQALEKVLLTFSENKTLVDTRYSEIYNNSDLSEIHKVNLELKKNESDTKYTELVDLINSVIADREITRDEETQVETAIYDYTIALSDLNRALDLAINEIAQAKANKAESSAKEYADDRLTNFVEATVYTQDKEELQAQIDNQISSHFYAYEPTMNNRPASDWTTDTIRDRHLGDLFYNTETGIAYRFAKENGTYKWLIVRDTGISEALEKASRAEETADGKMTVFVAQPTPPYQVGDLWDKGGSIYRAITNKPSSGSFSSSDWVLIGDVTSENVARDVENINGEPANRVITRISDAESTIIEHADLIAARVTETEFTQYRDGIETRLSTAEQRIRPDAIISTVKESYDWKTLDGTVKSTKEELDNLEISGRNIVSISILDTSSGVTREGYKYTISSTSSSGSRYLRFHRDNFELDSWYIASFKVKKVSGTVESIAGHINSFRGASFRVYRDGVLLDVDSWSTGDRSYPDDNEIHDYEIHFKTPTTYPSDSAPYFYIQPNRPNYEYAYVLELWDFQIEKGTKRTGWSPAPEDVDSELKGLREELSSHNTRIEQNSQQIELRATKTSVDSLTGRVESVESTITQTAEDVEFAFTNINSINSKINNAVTTIDGTGVTIKDGSFYLEDDYTDTKYSVATKTNLIYDHSFELCVPDYNNWNTTYNWANYVPYADRANSWYKVGNPKMTSFALSGYQDPDSAIFGEKSMVVNNSSYVFTQIQAPANTQITLSAYFQRHRGISAGSPSFTVRHVDALGNTISTIGIKQFAQVPNDYSVVRRSYTFTTPNLDPHEFIEIYVLASTTNWVKVDGVQAVVGSSPTLYTEEESLYEFMDGRIIARWLNTDNITAYKRIESLGDIVSNGTMKGTIHHRSHYLRIYPYSSHYEDGSNLKMFYSGKGYSSNQHSRLIINISNADGSARNAYLQAGNFYTSSTEEIKENIREWEDSVLDTYRNNLQLYTYNFKGDEEKETMHGVVIGDGYKTPSEIVKGDAVSQYDFNALNAKAIQELISIVDGLQEDVNTLKKML